MWSLITEGSDKRGGNRGTVHSNKHLLYCEVHVFYTACAYNLLVTAKQRAEKY